MGLVYPGVPKPIVEYLVRNFSIKYFVETGTYLGETAFWASQFFKTVFTVEKSIELWETAKKKYTQITNTEFILGDSRVVLEQLITQINCSALFWLDAHWSGENTYGEGDECSLQGELEIINKSKQENFILVDDARLFMLPPPHPHLPSQWPDIASVIELLRKTDRYIVIMDDVIIATPASVKHLLMSYYQDCSTQSWEKYFDDYQNKQKKFPSFKIK